MGKWINIPYIEVPNYTIKQSWIFFVWLSHKLEKDGRALEAFSNSTISWKILAPIIDQIPTWILHKTNLVKTVPLDAKGKLRYPSLEEKNKGFEVLLQDIQNFQPKLVILFWKQVINTITNDSRIHRLSCSEFRYGQTLFIGVSHPAYIGVYKRKLINTYLSSIQEKINQYL